jgi:hypothetical protein
MQDTSRGETPKGHLAVFGRQAVFPKRRRLGEDALCKIGFPNSSFFLTYTGLGRVVGGSRDMPAL